MKLKQILILTAIITSTHAISANLKPGTFICEDWNYNEVKLTVKQHPTKPEKAILNWQGKDRIVHRESSVSGAVRYEGAVSKLLYIQTPHHSVLLDDNTKKVILSECVWSN